MADPEGLDLLGLPKPKAKKEREAREVVVVRNARDAQRLRLERLMKNPEKEVHIPEPRHDSRGHKVPDFVRNVMGSSAGAGSGEFHVYRQLRKKEISRVKILEEQAERERLDQEFKQRSAAKEKAAELRTAKKRAKRLKKKQKMKNRAKKPKTEDASESDSSSESDDEQDAGTEKEKHVDPSNDDKGTVVKDESTEESKPTPTS